MTAPDMRDRLIAAHGSGDQRSFVELCRRNAETIVDQFAGWTKVPAEIRGDRRAVEAYVQALATAAEVLHALGHPGPREMIMPAGAANPINRWGYQFTKASRLSEAGEYAGSSAELHDLLADMEGSSGSGADDLRAKIVGLLGVNAMRLGDVPAARRHTEEALRRCLAAGDREGVWIYTENLDTLLVAEEIKDGTPAGRDLKHARERIAFAQDLSDAGRYPASNDVLRGLLDEVTGTGNAGVRYLGKIYGLLGLNCFRLGEPAAARRFTELARTECRRRQDIPGDRIYSANLEVIEGTNGPAAASPP